MIDNEKIKLKIINIPINKQKRLIEKVLSTKQKCLQTKNDIGKRNVVIEKQITSIIYEVKKKQLKGLKGIKPEGKWRRLEK